jgi:hypothetical protein
MKFQTKIIYYELVYKKNWRIADIVKEKKKSKVWDVKSFIWALGMRLEMERQEMDNEKQHRQNIREEKRERVLDLTRIDKDHLLFFGNF